MVWKHNTTTLASFAYNLGAAGNRTNLAETVNGVSRAFAWQYDALYRLTNETVSGTGPTGSVGYGMDAEKVSVPAIVESDFIRCAMKHYVVVCILAVGVSSQLLAPRQVRAQGTFNRTITFDGPPVIPPGWNVGVTYYTEEGMIFTPINPNEQFTRAGPGQAAWFPDNGTGYLLQGRFDSLSGSLGGIRFGLYAVDVSEFSTLYAFPAAVRFVGYRFDGSVVTTEFTTDGIIDGSGPLADFQTFYFDGRFADLVKFEVPTHTYAMDNLVFFIPEPGVWWLLLLGGAFVAVLRFFKRNE